MTGLQPASFEVERFELGPEACLEVRGRWSGVRGRRFMRPTLTAVAGGREHRLLAVLDHKPWIAEEGEAWLAAFPWSADPAALLQAELTVAPDVTVPLPPLSAGARRRRAGSRRTPVRDAGAAGEAGESNKGSKDDGRTRDGRLQVERDAALRSRDETLVELDTVMRDRDRLGVELGEALAARDAAIAERHDVIEAEVGLRIADLRAETERERAAAGQAARFASERDRARAECAQAISERDGAHAQRDAAQMERNRMLAQRDKARSLAEEATRRWEATAALGTRRTQERDAAASERDRAARERDAALEERDRLGGERDAAAEERDIVARERDAVLVERDRAVGERDAMLGQREQAREQIPVADERAATQLDLEDQPMYRGQERAAAAQAPTDTARRPRRPPAPGETPPRHNRVGAQESSSSPQAVGPRDGSDMWRARLLAVAALLVALVVFIVILTAK